SDLGSVALAESWTVPAVAVQVGSGRSPPVHSAGRTTRLDAAVKLTVGGWFGKTVGRRALRWPMKNWNPNPCGSSEKLKPSGRPFAVAGRVVPGTITTPREGTKTPLTWFIWTLVSAPGLKWLS